MENIRIMSLIEPNMEINPDATAIIGVDNQIITYKQLHQTVIKLSECLSLLGVKVIQRVAVVMDNGIDMMLSFLAVSNIAAFVPLSTDYSAEQYRYYFQILKIDYLLVPAGYDSDCIKTAEELNITVFNLKKEGNINEFEYEITGSIEANHSYTQLPAKTEDIALVLFTSGTTSLPKIVPRSHSNMYWSNQKRMQEMKLTDHERIVLTFPVYSGIWLTDSLAILSSGGTVIYSARLEPERFFVLVANISPTWILGSPVLFQSLVEYAQKNHIKSSCSSLHCIRSSGAPLTEELAARLKQVFNVAVYDGYGMTECGNISSTQNSPYGIKKGSVGVPENVEVGIMNENGDLQGSNTVGEIAVRGPQVIKAYDNEAAVNEAAFYGDWFKTGDSGYLDEDGYLYVIGRYKEIINRGGEKVSPYEIEAAISRHPDVLQVTVFPIPVGEGNEDVGAAVVLREGTELYLKDIRRFLNGKVTAFKMPSSLYVLTQMPASDAGKVQRKMLYEKIVAMGIPAQPLADANEPIIAPRNETEFKLYKIFRTILPVKEISVTDTFFELGGDSLKTAELFNQIKEAFETQVPLKYIFSNGTIEVLANYITGGHGSKKLHPFIMPYQETGTKTPLFFIHSADGESVMYRHIAINFDPERPFYGINFNPEAAKWKHPITFEQMAAFYIADIRTIQPEGPYILAGQCVGGIIAYEMAIQLKKAKQEIALLTIFDAILPDAEQKVQFRNKLVRNIEEVKRDGPAMYFKTKWYYYKKLIYKNSPNALKESTFNSMDKRSIISNARADYKMKKYDGDIVFFKPDNNISHAAVSSVELWSKLARDVRIIQTHGNHTSVFYPENAEYTRQVFEDVLIDIP